MYAALIKNGAEDLGTAIKLTRSDYTLFVEKNTRYYRHVTLHTYDKTITNNYVYPYMETQIIAALGKPYERELLIEILDDTRVLVNKSRKSKWNGRGKPFVAEKKDYIAYMIYKGKFVPGSRILKAGTGKEDDPHKLLGLSTKVTVNVNETETRYYAKKLIFVVTTKKITKKPVEFSSIYPAHA